MVKKVRDPFVDCFKGFMILWVIHIHTVFWTGYAYIPEVIRQITLLVDVPVFFLISGYVTRPNPFPRMLQKTIMQFMRIYSHYLIISCIIFGILLLCCFTTYRDADITQVFSTWSIVKMTPIGGIWDYLRVYNGSLWFLRDYLSVLVFVPILLGVRGIYKIRYVNLLFILLLTTMFPKEYRDIGFLFSTVGNVSFFLFFFMIGVFYREQEDHLDLKSLTISFSITLGLCLTIFNMDEGRVNIQLYKFPPSMQYLILSLPLIHLFMILKNIFQQNSINYSGKLSSFLEWCGVNIFYIYLFQGAICSLPYFYLDSLVMVLHPALLYISLLTFNIVFTLLASYCYTRMLDTAKSSFTRLKHG